MKKRVLFICSQNKLRSRTAHEIFSTSNKMEVDSAGTEKNALVVVELDHIQWADIIYVMESRHTLKLKKMFGSILKNKKIICLNIPDNYAYMDPILIEVLRAKLDGKF